MKSRCSLYYLRFTVHVKGTQVASLLCRKYATPCTLQAPHMCYWYISQAHRPTPSGSRDIACHPPPSELRRGRRGPLAVAGMDGCVDRVAMPERALRAHPCPPRHLPGQIVPRGRLLAAWPALLRARCTDLTFAKIGAPTRPTLPRSPTVRVAHASWPCIQTEKKVDATALTMASMSALVQASRRDQRIHACLLRPTGHGGAH